MEGDAMTTVGEFCKKIKNGEPLSDEESKALKKIEEAECRLREMLEHFREKLEPFRELWPFFRSLPWQSLYLYLEKKAKATEAVSEYFDAILADPRVQGDAEVYEAMSDVYKRFLDAHIGMMREELQSASEAMRSLARKAGKARHKPVHERHNQIRADYECMRAENPKLSKNKAAEILAEKYRLSHIQVRRIISKPES
jgi:hypothetical protein